MSSVPILSFGRIMVPAPFENAYVVRTMYGTVMATAQESGGPTRAGHVGGGTYTAGTYVLLAMPGMGDDDTPSDAFPNLILGAFNPFLTFDDTEFQPTHLGVGVSDEWVNEAFRTVVEAQPTGLMASNRGARRPVDLCAGDWFKQAALGPAFAVLEFMSKMAGSPVCNSSMYAAENFREDISLGVSEDVGSIWRECVHRGLVPVEVTSYALDFLEALGGKKPLTRTAGGLLPTAEQQTGLFRRDSFTGGVEGRWDIFRAPPDTRAEHVFGEHVYPGMLSEVARMDGVYRVSSAKEIRFEKTYAIVAPWKKRDLRGAPLPEPGPALPSEEQLHKDITGLATEDEVHALLPLLYKKLGSAEEEQLFFQGLRRDSGVWHFPSLDEVKQNVFAGEEPTLRPLSAQEQEYTLEDVISKEVEVYPGRRVRLFKNSSVFLMADDGGLILGDGYGGELRMHRGTVTIAAAGDLRILPGRNLVEQVPGSRFSRVYNRVEFASTQGSLALKAEHNMQLVSGGAEGGVLTLENRSDSQDARKVTARTLEEGLPVGAGVVLKSIAGVHTYSSAYSVLPLPRSAESRTGMNLPGEACDIFMDSGRGTTCLSGSAGVLSFRQDVSVTLQDSLTGLYLRGGRILALAPGDVTMVAPFVSVDKAAGRSMRPAITRAGVDTKRLDSMPTSTPVFEVNGEVRAGGMLVSKRGVLTEGAVTSKQGANPDPITNWRTSIKLQTDQRSRALQKSYLDMVGEASGAYVTLAQRLIANGMLTEYGVRATDFVFPASESAVYGSSAYKQVLPKWHSMLRTTSKWLERGVSGSILEDTYPYPGKTVFEKEKPLIDIVDGAVVKLPMSEYKRNA